MPIHNLVNLQEVKLEVPDPQLLQRWEPFDGSTLYPERGRKYLLFGNEVVIKLPAPNPINGEIILLKVTEGKATVDPQTHVVDALQQSLSFNQGQIVRLIGTEDKWILHRSAIRSANPSGAIGGSTGGSPSDRQTITQAESDFLYESDPLTVGVRPFKVSIATGFDPNGEPLDVDVEVEADPYALPNLPPDSDIYFWIDAAGNLGYTTVPPREVDFLPDERLSLKNVSQPFAASATAANHFSSSTLPQYAFNADSANIWLGGPINAVWLQIDFAVPTLVDLYRITAPNGTNGGVGANCSPSWTITGWTGTSWVIVDSRSGTGWSNGEVRTYEASAPGYYLKYRYNPTKTTYPGLQLDFLQSDQFDSVFHVPLMVAHEWDTDLGFFVPTPKIFIGQARTDATKLVMVRPYRVGSSVWETGVVEANQAKEVWTGAGSERYFYSVSSPEGASTNALIRWNLGNVVVRSDASGDIKISGWRRY